MKVRETKNNYFQSSMSGSSSEMQLYICNIHVATFLQGSGAATMKRHPADKNKAAISNDIRQ